MTRALRLTACLASMLIIAGCAGYQVGTLIPADIESVNVMIVGNNTFWRFSEKVQNLSPTRTESSPRPAHPMTVTLTRRISEEIVRRTHLKLKNGETADSILEARILDVDHKTIQRDGKDNLTRGEMSIVVEFTWRDRRTGRVIASRGGISRATEYNLDQNESTTTAAGRSFYYIAERIVEGMQEGF
jgi:Lipopolysaccharide-assembly